MFVLWRSHKTTKFYVSVSLPRLKQSLTILSSLPNKMYQSQLFIVWDAEHWPSWRDVITNFHFTPQVITKCQVRGGGRGCGGEGFRSSPRNWNFSWTSPILQKVRCVPEGYCFLPFILFMNRFWCYTFHGCFERSGMDSLILARQTEDDNREDDCLVSTYVVCERLSVMH